jgi:ATP-dependent RNA helicase DDX5/DBP2
LTAAFSSAAQTSEDDEDDLTPAEFRKVHQISLLDAVGRPLRETFEPILRFEDAPFEDKLKTALLKQGYTSPTPTQAQSWPIVTQKRDVISVARTGSGKTCGFLLPAFQKIIEERATGDEFEIEEPSGKKWSFGRGQPRKQPKVLVLAPTRELCMQIHTEAQKFARFANIDPVCLYGGSPKGPQVSDFFWIHFHSL